MKLTFALPFLLGLAGTSAYAQDVSKAKHAPEKAVVTKKVEKEKVQVQKEEKARLEDFDINFRGQEQRVRNSIYTLGGKLTPAGKKPGEGC